MDAQWLKTQFSLHPGKTRTGLAKALGLGTPAISKILKGQRQVKAREYEIMRQYFGMPSDGERSVKNKPMGETSALYTLEPLRPQNALSEKENEGTLSDWVMPAGLLSQRTDAPPDQIKIFQVGESTMEPHFKRGEHVILDLTDRTPSPPGAFVISDGFGYMIRHCEYVPKSKPPQTRISGGSAEPQILETSALEIIGRVIGKMQWL